MKYLKLHPRLVTGLDTSGSDSMASDAKSTGENAINSFDPKTTAGAQQTSLGAGGLGGLLGGETGNYINKYAGAVANNPTVTSLYNKGNEMFNVPTLANYATYLNNLVTNAVPSAYAGAKGFDIGATDINNGIASKLAYLGPQSSAATANYNTAAGLASNFVQAGQAQNAQNLLPVQAEGGLVSNLEAAQASGWNQTLAGELQGYINKMNAGVTLSGNEMTRANQLASLEEDYQSKLAVAQTQNQYKDIAQNANLFNTFTGSMVNPTIANPKGVRTFT